MDLTSDEIKGKILHKLAKHRIWKAKHTSIDNLPKGFPSHMRGRVKKLTKEMMIDGLLTLKITNYGQHVSLNINQKNEIQKLIDRFLLK